MWALPNVLGDSIFYYYFSSFFCFVLVIYALTYSLIILIWKSEVRIWRCKPSKLYKKWLLAAWALRDYDVTSIDETSVRSGKLWLWICCLLLSRPCHQITSISALFQCAGKQAGQHQKRDLFLFPETWRQGSYGGEQQIASTCYGWELVLLQRSHWCAASLNFQRK